MADTLGVLAHRGGLVVERPELTVGVVNAVSRPTGLEVELLARRPLDRRSPTARQAGIRAGQPGPPVAPRQLLPAFDEGLDLRVGWLDHDGRAHWEFGSSSSSSSGDGAHGPSLRTTLDFPPLFDRMSLVLAWPEIGFPETVLDLPLPDRETVERDTVSIWDAPVPAGTAPSPPHRVGPAPSREVAVETGRRAALPRVLNRGADAVVVLTRLTAVGDALSMEILSVARGERAQSIRIPGERPGASVDVPHGGLRPDGGSAGGGRSTFEYTANRPADGVLTLVVGWPAAGLPDVRVAIAVRSDH